MWKLPILILIAFFYGCNSAIKNENAQVAIEEGTETDPNSFKSKLKNNLSDSHVFWVGSFDPHKDIDITDKQVLAGDVLSWGRSNKISISIDKIIGDSIIGHSVVAGNDRPFFGKIVKKNGIEECIVKEPGDDKYDGKFTFKIANDNLQGIWEAYKPIDIPKREYILNKKTYKYNPDIMLERKGQYGDWTKFIDHGTKTEIIDEGTPEEEVLEWFDKEYASSTDKIFEINASNTLLTKADVENLTNSDLLVIRNTIYARHGYSFKSRPLRVFFDEQEWYIPVHADIKQNFSEIEKKNIKLLLRFEKNAKEYYDSFGRG